MPERVEEIRARMEQSLRDIAYLLARLRRVEEAGEAMAAAHRSFLRHVQEPQPGRADVPIGAIEIAAAALRAWEAAREGGT